MHTKFGGVFLFVPFLAAIPFDKMLLEAELPGSKMIPGGAAVRSLLALKLFGSARHSHVMSYVLDGGLALFAGLNEIPKRSFLTEYSCRIDPLCYPRLMRLWFEAMATLGLEQGLSFDLDFHTIPFHGEDASQPSAHCGRFRQNGHPGAVAKGKENSFPLRLRLCGVNSIN